MRRGSSGPGGDVGKEIERKFLVTTVPDVAALEGQPMVQGYLRADAGGSVRVRITGEGGMLNVKGPVRGIERLEFEYPVPAADARQMLDALCIGAPVEKVRYRIAHQGFVWELDVFSARNEGLVLAEVELADAADEPALPDWVGAEVTGDERSYNAYLARTPYGTWPTDSR
jgi:CYTH domain-containing protein